MATPYRGIVPSAKIINKTINGKYLELGPYINAYQETFNLNTPADTFRLSLIPSVQEVSAGYNVANLISLWQKVIKKGDIISIGIDEEDSFLYRIDGIFPSYQYYPYKRTLILVGRSFAGMLIDDDIVFAPELSFNQTVVDLLGDERANFLGILRGLSGKNQSQFINQNPLAAIVWIMLNMPSIHQNIPYVDYDEEGNEKDGKNDKIGKYFTFDLKSFKQDKLFDHNLSQYAGSVWNYITSCVDPMFYEVFVDTVKENGKPRPQLIVRPKPWDRETDITHGKDEVISPTLQDFTITPKTVTIGKITGKHKEVSLDAKKLEQVAWLWDAGEVGSVLTGVTPDENNVPTGEFLLIDNAFKTRVTNEVYHTIDETEDYGNSIGTIITDVVNFYTMHSSKDTLANTVLARYGYLYPLIDLYSVKRRGMKKLEGKSNLLKEVDPYETKEDGAPKREFFGEKVDNSQNDAFFDNINPRKKIYPIEETVKLRDRLFSWYRYNEIFRQGPMHVLGKDKYRKGDKIFCPHHTNDEGDKGVYYYIQGGTRDLQIDEKGSSYTCNLQLVRGENPAEIERYRRLAGYDLYDRGKESDGDRVCPIVRIDSVSEDSLKSEGFVASEPPSENTTGQQNNNVTIKQYRPVDGFVPLTNKGIETIKKYYNSNRWQSDNAKYYTSEGNPSMSPGTSLSVSGLIDLINQECLKEKVNANIVGALIYHESEYCPVVVSPTGCAGLGQFEDKTWRGIGLSLSREEAKTVGVGGSQIASNLRDPRLNPITMIKAIVKLLVYDKGWHSNPKLAIRNYNGDTKKVPSRGMCGQTTGQIRDAFVHCVRNAARDLFDTTGVI